MSHRAKRGPDRRSSSVDGATTVIRAGSEDARTRHWVDVILPASTSAAQHAARVGQVNRRDDGLHTGVLSMIHQTTVATTDTEVEDRSMRVVEWSLALIAAIAAGVLAFIR